MAKGYTVKVRSPVHAGTADGPANQASMLMMSFFAAGRFRALENRDVAEKDGEEQGEPATVLHAS